MKRISLFCVLTSLIVGCQSTEEGFTKQELALLESIRVTAATSNLSESELVIAALGTTCYKSYLLLTKYDYHIESISKNEIVYFQPNKAKIIREFNIECPNSILK
ncbi:hypothetical protein N474_23615 [Pseudoalteromonas luteoviolacea CPMOR-2]|uniref:Lipoprotein n=1 Tax=Pseudoalteromonas luteoviolacea DSM 6061 TaxID=1365250 RepID=A0A161ZWI0_9GAMM|nr:hypothetical protein [Pseudoalteromonas luteoviolacea]KZN36659.1 hypothetical protein N475_17185 [Pseudoalteromonas luteoviolacea DSM 6061]KZN51841.1 hypothetical protein N474_23615 [Pseudoalteromonas luteoviolacea CPMOR-2]